MALAFLYPKPEKGGRGKKGKAAETADFSQRRLREARQVLHYSRELAEAVRDGPMSLDAALKIVRKAKHVVDTASKRFDAFALIG